MNGVSDRASLSFSHVIVHRLTPAFVEGLARPQTVEGPHEIGQAHRSDASLADRSIGAVEAQHECPGSGVCLRRTLNGDVVAAQRCGRPAPL